MNHLLRPSVRLSTVLNIRKPIKIENKWLLCRSCLINKNVNKLLSHFLIEKLIYFLCQKFRFYSNQRPEKQGFFGKVFENIKQEMSKNKEMKESLKKFREEAQKLEESDALKKARHKFVFNFVLFLKNSYSLNDIF